MYCPECWANAVVAELVGHAGNLWLEDFKSRRKLAGHKRSYRHKFAEWRAARPGWVQVAIRELTRLDKLGVVPDTELSPMLMSDRGAIGRKAKHTRKEYTEGKTLLQALGFDKSILPTDCLGVVSDAWRARRLANALGRKADGMEMLKAVMLIVQPASFFEVGWELIESWSELESSPPTPVPLPSQVNGQLKPPDKDASAP